MNAKTIADALAVEVERSREWASGFD